MDDFRIRVGFLDHPKTRRLKRRIGLDAVEVLIRLFEFVTKSPERRDGNLRGLDNEAIADALHYERDADELVKALRECGWIEGRKRAYRIHDWAEINPYVANWQLRSDAARNAARMRWASRGHADRNAESDNPHADRNAPSPSPSPSPKPKGGNAPRIAAVDLASGDEPNPDVGKVMDRYLERYPKRIAQTMKPENRTMVRARLAEGYTVEDLGRAVAGNAASEFHAEKGYTSIRHVFKDPETVDRFIGEAPKPRAGTYKEIDKDDDPANPETVAAARAAFESTVGKIEA